MAVLLSPVGGVAAQFFTNAGVPLSGGKIYTYAAGTSTPQATYTTGAGNIQHSNPIVLNAAGRVPTGEIWLTDGLSYKFVLKDANDVLIATYDNIVGINSNFVNFVNQQEIQTATAGQTVFTLTTMEYQPGIGNLSVFVDGVNQYGPGAQYAYTETSSTVVTFVSGLHVGASVKFTTTEIQNSGIGDASQITYTYPAVGAVQESVEERLAQYVSVKDFGAVGDGVADDTVAFTNAGSIDTNVQVFIPAGTYLLNSNPTPSGNVTWVFAEGADLTGVGVLPRNTTSYSTLYAPAWVGASYNSAWGYMPPNSVVTNYPRSGNLGFTAMGLANQFSGATIGFSSAIENVSSGDGSSWCYYGTTLANTSSSNCSTQCVEYDISAASTNVGSTVGIALNVGGEAANQPGMGYTFQSVGAGIQIGANNIGNYANVNFTKGIYIVENAIEPVFKKAIELGQNLSIRWTGTGGSILSSIGSSVTTASKGQSLLFTDNGLLVYNENTKPIFQVNNNTIAGDPNRFLIEGSAAGSPPTIYAAGGDTNIDIKLFPKGSGTIDIASTGVVGSAGGIVNYLPIKINGSNYKLALYSV